MKFGQAARVARGEDWVMSRYWDYIQHRDLEREAMFAPAIIRQPDRLRIGNWSASSQGTCQRKQQLTYLGMPQKPPDEKAANHFINGDYVHYRHQICGLSAGYISEVEVPVMAEQYSMRGTMDGILSNGEGLEIKSINDYGFREVSTFGPKKEHVAQVNAYMLARPDIDAFRIVYENKNTQLVKEFRVERNDAMIAMLRNTLNGLNEKTAKEELFEMLPECKQARGFQFTFCPYADICEDAQWPTSRSLRIR